MVEFLPEVTMHCRVVAYRYTDPESREVYTPSKGEIEVIRDYVEKAFPVTRLCWSSVTIDAPRSFNRLRAVAAPAAHTDEQVDRVYMALMQHLLALRNQDISQNATSLSSMPDSEARGCEFSPATLYMGVLNDPSGRFGRSSMDSPKFATPHVVAFAEGQSDGQMAAHEFGHILGRLHPGIPSKLVHGRLGQTDQYDQFESNGGCQSDGEARQGDDIAHRMGYISKETKERWPQEFGHRYRWNRCLRRG